MKLSRANELLAVEEVSTVIMCYGYIFRITSSVARAMHGSDAIEYITVSCEEVGVF